MDINFPTNISIILSVYVISEILKATKLKSDSSKKILPPVCAAIGGLISILLFYFVPESIDATNVISACTTGMASGLAAVGCNQVYKQFKKFSTVTMEDIENDEQSNVESTGENSEVKPTIDDENF